MSKTVVIRTKVADGPLWAAMAARCPGATVADIASMAIEAIAADPVSADALAARWVALQGPRLQTPAGPPTLRVIR